MTTNIEQLKASNPFDSVWVSASAGTGKTKVLVDRVLRLLLQYGNPDKILCLTFTKAAAAEMNFCSGNNACEYKEPKDFEQMNEEEFEKYTEEMICSRLKNENSLIQEI